VPVSEEQNRTGGNTFDEVVNYYATNHIPLPLNINGTPFLRPLSSIHESPLI
jgi:hypothetical protein